MKRFLLSICLALSLALPTSAPAQAILGLGKCEKVKKEILSLEKLIRDVYEKGRGYNYEQTVFKEKSKIWEPTNATISMVKKMINNDPVPKIWKLGTNNPKCFTNTQKMQIKNMQGINYQNYLVYPSSQFKYVNTGECRTLMENNEYTFTGNYAGPDKKTKDIIAKCSLGKVDTIFFKTPYISIYDY
jgi:hypothetical protein